MELKKQYNLYRKFKNFFLKKGKASVAISIMKNLVFFFSKKYKVTSYFFLLTIFKKLNSFIEIRQIKIKRRLYYVPFSISISRRIYLVLKRLKQAISLDKRKVSIFKKVRTEIFLLLSKEKVSKSLEIKKNDYSKILENRANIHYRW